MNTKSGAPDSQMKDATRSALTIRADFHLNRKFPEELRALDEISRNFFWSWQPEGENLFRDLDANLWDIAENNPRRFLAQIRDLRLWQKAADAEYVERLNRFYQRQEKYLAEEPSTFGVISRSNPVAYFCAEFGVHHSLPIYSGGLGILAGDHLKSASDLNVPLVAVGILYGYGFFRQHIGHDGRQQESYENIFDTYRALTPVADESGKRIEVMIHMRGREVFAQAWLAKIGRISLYLLDTNVTSNSEVDRLVTGHLYGGDTETRVVQEKILGIGGVRLLRELKIAPSVFHLNEGHSAFLTLELAREFLAENPNATIDEAIQQIRNKCVFTTHTPVSAGNDTFPPELIDACFDKTFIKSLHISHDELFTLGRVDPDNKLEWFGMTPLALRMSRRANGVSRRHGEVSRELWKPLFSGKSQADDVPIMHVTNGVHPATWIAQPFQKLYENNIGSNWKETLHNEVSWQEALAKISNEALWKTHQLLKNKLIAYVRRRTFSENIGEREIISEHKSTLGLFHSNVLTIGFARRIAAYKRWNLLLTDIERLLATIDDESRPVQFVFAGKAHPSDEDGKSLLQNLIKQNHRAEWLRRAVFIEDYDQEVARHLVQGVDVWMNVPRRPLEASGTSGIKAAMNGALNFSVLDGWWLEAFDGENGFSIGADVNEELDEDEIDKLDAESLYEILEKQIIPTYYENDDAGRPQRWIEMMRQSLATITPRFSSDRMLNEYVTKIYV